MIMHSEKELTVLHNKEYFSNLDIFRPRPDNVVIMDKKVSPNPSLIEKVVLPLKTDAMDRADKQARENIAAARKELAAHNNDLHIVAPYPSGAVAKYFSALAKYKFFSSITKWRDNQRVGFNGPCFVDVNSNLAAKYVKEARDNAAFQYDAFVSKLDKKIGSVKSAILEGNHVWGFSFLTVITTAGEQQIWKTQMIINQSKLGKLFNQFPTRMVKTAGR